MELTSPILNESMKKIYSRLDRFSDQEDDDVLIDSNRRVNNTRRFVLWCTYLLMLML